MHLNKMIHYHSFERHHHHGHNKLMDFPSDCCCSNWNLKIKQTVCVCVCVCIAKLKCNPLKCFNFFLGTIHNGQYTRAKVQQVVFSKKNFQKQIIHHTLYSRLLNVQTRLPVRTTTRRRRNALEGIYWLIDCNNSVVVCTSGNCG